ncbi:putative defensin-like protein 129 [Cucurbita moschata]|uniref:Defensin-like protein 129 n=1 Tax=Cucurbita moschata TaxID=3662 RepID=A0A6J1EAA9_CUCMO|nr:putative defensin-like protein 129 [Cucurbita moschata]
MAKFCCPLLFLLLVLSVALMMPEAAQASPCHERLYETGCEASACRKQCEEKYSTSTFECVPNPLHPPHVACLCFFDCPKN